MTKQEQRELRQGFNDGLQWVTKRFPGNDAYDRGYKHGKAHPKSMAKQRAYWIDAIHRAEY
jgi:hypothetical protein